MSGNNYLPIKQWAADDRPREKMLAHGVRVLSDTELLAILIATGTKKLSAIDLARNVLKSVDGNLNILGKTSVSDLTKILGIGDAKAVTIVAAMELGRRRQLADVDLTTIRTSSDIFHIMQPILSDLQHEEFWAIYLNNANKIVDKQQIAIGGVTSTTVDVRIVMRYAIEKLVSSIILVHNHPSGALQPSKCDTDLTAQIASAAKLFNIKIIDHIIVAGAKYFSFADEGLI